MAVSGGTIVKSTTSELVWYTAASGGFLIDDSQLAGQNVRDLNITGIHWSGDWVVTRGANTVFDSGAVETSGSWPLKSMGISLNDLSAGANVHCVNTGGGSILLEFRKVKQ